MRSVLRLRSADVTWILQTEVESGRLVTINRDVEGHDDAWTSLEAKRDVARLRERVSVWWMTVSKSRYGELWLLICLLLAMVGMASRSQSRDESAKSTKRELVEREKKGKREKNTDTEKRRKEAACV